METIETTFEDAALSEIREWTDVAEKGEAITPERMVLIYLIAKLWRLEAKLEEIHPTLS